jgi:hypothetical protein
MVVGQGLEVSALLLPVEPAKEAVSGNVAGGTPAVWGRKGQGSNYHIHIIVLCKWRPTIPLILEGCR